MITNIFSKNSLKILTLFGLSPGSKFNRNDIKDKTILNNVPLDKELNTLVNSNILIKTKNYYSLNFEFEYTKTIIEIIQKQFRQLKELPLNIYYIIVDIVDYLSSKKGLDVYLFGSYSKLIFTNKSDIDIAIIYENKINKKDIDEFILKLEKKYEKIVEIHLFKDKEFYKNKKDPLIASILKDGVKLI